MIALPPLNAGAVARTTTDVKSALDARPMTGAPGTVAGTTSADGSDAEPVPTAFDAVTVHS